ncbi:hypothetical protein CRE_20661 [Caenorhabditis remanei]|uniref:Sdz-33 F-box domain-containing protein n=1 Tax=Caenorhabditis remanei TaxID=31234 RepID=E3NVT8_CAERE|nr:hypothetical protein CRE_20661 [Caenorhabditis remanei]
MSSPSPFIASFLHINSPSSYHHSSIDRLLLQNGLSQSIPDTPSTVSSYEEVFKAMNSFEISYLHIKNDNFNGKIPKNLKELHIDNSQWIGYERLLEIDCKSVILEKNLITNKEWNMFFKKWIAMKTHLNLEYLEIDYRDIEKFRALVLHDIPHEVMDGGVKRVLKT